MELKARGKKIERLVLQLGELQYNWRKNWEEIKVVSMKLEQLWEVEESY